MLAELTFHFENIAKHNGIGIAVTGLLIVFTSLVLISLAIAAMPKVLAALEDYLPAEHDHHGSPASKPSSDEAVAVAIGFALHSQLQLKDKTG